MSACLCGSGDCCGRHGLHRDKLASTAISCGVPACCPGGCCGRARFEFYGPAHSGSSWIRRAFVPPLNRLIERRVALRNSIELQPCRGRGAAQTKRTANRPPAPSKTKRVNSTGKGRSLETPVTHSVESETDSPVSRSAWRDHMQISRSARSKGQRSLLAVEVHKSYSPPHLGESAHKANSSWAPPQECRYTLIWTGLNPSARIGKTGRSVIWWVNDSAQRPGTGEEQDGQFPSGVIRYRRTR